MRLKEIAISLTDSCNAKCKMCGIWNIKDKEEFDIKLLSKFPKNFKSIANITLTGGEPFLKNDILEIIKGLKKLFPYARIVICTNGILTDLIVSCTRQILKIEPKVAVRISLDGINGVHDYIRGVQDAYKHALSTIRRLKEIGVKDLGVNFTVINENIDQLLPVYNLTKNLRINFNYQIAHSSDFYFQKENIEIKDKSFLAEELKRLICSELKTFSPYRLFKTYYLKGMIDHLNYNLRDINCSAGSLFCYINTKGEVYPCIMLEEKMGDLRENNFEEIWNSRITNSIREKVKNCKKSCWLMCTVYPVIKNNPFKALPWIIKNKIKAHLGIGVLGG